MALDLKINYRCLTSTTVEAAAAAVADVCGRTQRARIRTGTRRTGVICNAIRNIRAGEGSL